MRVKIGDVVEIKTKIGLAYAIYTHRHTAPPRYGAMLRIFDQIFSSRPENMNDLADLPIRFTTFFPLQAAVNRGLVEIAGNINVRDELLAFPVFRSGTPHPITKKVESWWLWDGEKSWQVGNLTPEQRKLSIRGVWNDTMLIKRMEDGWRPENDSR